MALSASELGTRRVVAVAVTLRLYLLYSVLIWCGVSIQFILSVLLII